MNFDDVFYTIGQLIIPACLIYVIVRIVKNKKKRLHKGFTLGEKISLFLCILFLIGFLVGIMLDVGIIQHRQI